MKPLDSGTQGRIETRKNPCVAGAGVVNIGPRGRRPLNEGLHAVMAELDRVRHELALAAARVADRRVHHVEPTVDPEPGTVADDYLRAYA